MYGGRLIGALSPGHSVFYFQRLWLRLDDPFAYHFRSDSNIPKEITFSFNGSSRVNHDNVESEESR